MGELPNSRSHMKVGLRPGQDTEHFPMSLFKPHEAQARRNHYQSLEQLSERGGLSWCEASAILEDRPWRPDPDAEAKVRARSGEHQSPIPLEGDNG